MKEFVSPTMVVMEIGKRQFFSYHSNVFCERKKLHQKLESYRFKLPLKKPGWSGQGKIR